MLKCNITKLVRFMVVVVMTAACINIAVFLKSHKGNDEMLYHGLRHFDGKKIGMRQTNTPPVPLRLNSTTTCPGLQMRKPHSPGEFQTIGGTSQYVYSAYLVGKDIKVIALREQRKADITLTCQMWFHLKDRESLYLAPGGKEELPEDHGRRYQVEYIYCGLPVHLLNEAPVAVSLVTGNGCSLATNILMMPGPTKMTSQFTVCVTPLNYRYSRAYELVEMIEMNKLLGAQKFVFYNHSTGPNVDKVLKMYAETNEVEVHPWHLPLKVDTWPPTGEPEIHYFAQIAALNDCLHRHRNQSKYLVYQDLDEFIIPYKHDTWAELLTARESHNGEKAVFQFKCIFFRKEWPRPAKNFEADAKKYKSVVLSYTNREKLYLMFGTRSKYIINPRMTSLVGVHQVWTSSGALDKVDESDASLHHYRSWEKPNEQLTRIEDESAAQKYGSRLVERLRTIWSKLEGVPMDINISTYGDHV